MGINAIERSLVIEIYFQNNLVSRIEQEGGLRLDIIKYKNQSMLRAIFDLEGAQSEIKIIIKPSIMVKLDTLLTY